jgi:CheY-like chemotaxis protein
MDVIERQSWAVTIKAGDGVDVLLLTDCGLVSVGGESLMNALKYAEGWVGEDDGDFDLAAAAVTTSKFWIFSIHERVRALGGWFDLQFALGKGAAATLVPPTPNTRAPSSDCETSPEPKTQQSKLHRQDPKIRILLVDDHAMVRQGLRSVLDSYADIEVIGEAWDGQEAVAGTDRLRPAVVVMDINMPKMNGIEATAHIKARHPEVIVIGLSVNVGGENEIAMKNAGAAMLLTKEAAVDELHQAIKDALGMRVTPS